MVNYSQLFTCQGGMQPFEGNLSTHGCLTSLRNKPQQKWCGQLSASIYLPELLYSQCVQLSFDDEKCALLLCVWKPAFLKSGHICVAKFTLILSTVWEANSECTTWTFGHSACECDHAALNVFIEYMTSVDLAFDRWAHVNDKLTESRHHYW